jgi:type II secretory pathway component PulM
MSARDWLNNLSLRERNLVYVATGLVAIGLIYLLLVLPLHTAHTRLQSRVDKKSADLAWIQAAAPKVQAASAKAPAAGASDESLVVLVDRTARQAGLGGAVKDQSPSGSNGIRLRLEGAPFDVVVVWLADLQQQYGVAVDSASVDSTPNSGLVNASLTLSQPPSAG